MNTALAAILPYLSTVLTICIGVGCFFALRGEAAKQANAIQDRVIAALEAQNKMQAQQIEAHEREISRLNRIVETIQAALKRRGLRIEIDGDSITLIDDHARRSHTVKIQMTAEEDEDKKEAKP